MNTPTRRYDIDWMRILVVASLIPFHTARIFDFWEPNYVKNAELNGPLSYMISFFAVWNMPLLFLLAGSASGYALEFRNGAAYLKERFKRLFVPLLFGVLVIVPPQAYLARFQNPDYGDSYWRFLTDYFQVRGDLTGYTGLFTPAHLWFILYLLVFSAIALPLFLRLRRDRRLSDWLARECERPSALFFLAVPLGVAGALPDIGGKNPFYYFLLFVYGYLFMSDARFAEILEKNRKRALRLGVVTMAFTLTLWSLPVRMPEYSLGDILFYLVRTFNAWFWVVALLGYGARYLNGTNRWYRYANEASYPFYILHQTVIVAIGYFVIAWSVGLWTKFFLICLLSFAATLFLYEICVRRANMTRFLFGMKPEIAQEASQA